MHEQLFFIIHHTCAIPSISNVSINTATVVRSISVSTSGIGVAFCSPFLTLINIYANKDSCRISFYKHSAHHCKYVHQNLGCIHHSRHTGSYQECQNNSGNSCQCSECTHQHLLVMQLTCCNTVQQYRLTKAFHSS